MWALLSDGRRFDVNDLHMWRSEFKLAGHSHSVPRRKSVVHVKTWMCYLEEQMLSKNNYSKVPIGTFGSMFLGSFLCVIVRAHFAYTSIAFCFLAKSVAFEAVEPKDFHQPDHEAATVVTETKNGRTPPL